jgi:3-hydroxybutyryl-CoA dehydrogenase
VNIPAVVRFGRTARKGKEKAEMKIDDVKNICVVGAGNMGHQISLLCAIHGYKTTCTDIAEEVLKKAEKFADSYLPGRVKKGKMTEDQAKQARENISFTSSLE